MQKFQQATHRARAAHPAPATSQAQPTSQAQATHPAKRRLAAFAAGILAFSGLAAFSSTALSQAAPNPADSTAYTTNQSATYAEEIYFFDMGKLAQGRSSTDVKTGAPVKAIHPGAEYTFTSADGLPAGVEIDVKIAAIDRNDQIEAAYAADNTTFTYDMYGLAASPSAHSKMWSTAFRPGGDYGVANYAAPTGAYWTLGNTKTSLANKTFETGWQAQAVGTVSFDLEVHSYIVVDGQRIPLSLPLIAVDGEASNPTYVNSTNNAWDRIEMTTNGDPWQVIQNIDGTPYHSDAATRWRNSPNTSAEFLQELDAGTAQKYYGVQTEFRSKTYPPGKPLISAPLMISHNASTLSISIVSGPGDGGRGGVITGVYLPYDTGDAPDSYGFASHLLTTDNGPFVGSARPDSNLPYRVGNFANDTEEDLTAETISSLPDANADFPLAVAYKNAGATTYTATIPVGLAQNTDGTFEETYVSAWIDVDQNGKFGGDGELAATEMATATITPDQADANGQATATLTWNLDWPDQAQSYPVRVRVSTDKSGIAVASDEGRAAQDGEAEDLEMYVVVIDEAATVGLKNETQTSDETDAQLLDKNGNVIAGYQDAGLPNGAAMFALPADSSITATYSLKNDAGESVTTLDVDGGSYEIDPTTGVVTFTPDDDFVGTPAAATIQLLVNGTADSRLESTYQPVIVGLHGLVSDEKSEDNPLGKPATLTPTTTDIDVTTIVFDPDQAPSGALLTNGDKSLYVPGEGTWTVDDTGTFTFTPDVGFSDNPTPVGYSAKDTYGQPAENTGLLTVTYVTADIKEATTTGPQGKLSQTSEDQDTNDNGYTPAQMFGNVPLDNATFTLINASGEEVTELTVEGEGTYTIDPATGVVTFAQEPTFSGEATTVTIQVTTSEANNSMVFTSKYTPFVSEVLVVAPSEQSLNNKVGAIVTLSPDYGTDLNPASARFSNGEKTLVVAGEGTWSFDDAGKATFTPEPGFFDNPTDVTITVRNVDGVASTTSGTLHVTYLTDTQVPSTSTKPENEQQTSAPGSQMFLDSQPAADKPYSFEGGLLEVTTDGQGTYQINPDTGVVTFTPVTGYVGTTFGVTVFQTLENGGTLSTTYTPTVTALPFDAPDAFDSGLIGDVLSPTPDWAEMADAELDFATFAFTAAEGIEVLDPYHATQEGVGSWAYDPATGEVTFTPEAGFVGDSAAIQYSIQDIHGNDAVKAGTLSVEYSMIGTVDVETSGEPLEPQKSSSVSAMFTGVPDGRGSYAFGGGALTYDVDGVGNYAIDAVTGAITFTPALGFDGPAPSATAVLTVDNGRTFSAVYTPTVNDHTPQNVPSGAGEADYGQSVTFTLPIPDSVDANTLRIDLASALKGSVLSADGRTLTVPGEGTWVLGVDGTVTFTPVDGFTGKASTISYSGFDVLGFPVGNVGMLDAVIGPKPADPPVATQPDPGTATGGGPGANSALAKTGVDVAGPGIIAGLLLALGTGLLVVRKRKGDA